MYIFFFQQKTAYEVRISDWSSDVCASDLFNNLLMVASGGLDLMERTQDAARLGKLRAGIRQALDRGAKLTRQLLAFSRRTPLNPEVVDLRERIRDRKSTRPNSSH